MRAAIIRGYGGLEQIALGDVPRPVAQGSGDVVVALRAAALNHLDIFVIGGLPGITHQFPHVLGADGAGVVESVGADVKRFKPGDRVLINPGISCGHCEYCTSERQPLCASYAILGEHRAGTFAEAVCVPEVNLAPLAPGISWHEAAAFPLATLTAWGMVSGRARLMKGETILIRGIGGGVALASLAAARLIGARTIVTSSSDEKLARARALGADETINHATGDVPREVRRLTAKQGVDVVMDNVGAATWETSLRCLGRAGRLVTCGGTSGPMVTTDVRRLFWYQWSILGSTMGSNAEFAEIAGHFAHGTLKPVVDRVYPLDQARQALERLQRGEQFGKVVLDIGAAG
ncbi:MAG TPA: zinc-binding dehydrogenase [Gemmatimonadales bacterium]|jgi:NADPH:quinone reductase-like Zn-dependent oxidoreductase